MGYYSSVSSILSTSVPILSRNKSCLELSPSQAFTQGFHQSRVLTLKAIHETKASTMTSECSKLRIPHVLTVAGSDSGAGAGIQADLKTCAARGMYCSSVITAVTAQNTVGVQDVNILLEGFVSEQLKSVLSDMHVDVVKTGMLPSIGIVKVLYHSLKEFPVQGSFSG